MGQTEPWLRWYRGTSMDDKLRMVAFQSGVMPLTIIGAWASILERCDDDGVFALVDNPQADRCVLSSFLQALGGMMEAEADRTVNLMEEHGLLLHSAHGWIVPKWKKRQFKNESAAEKQRRWRRRQNLKK